MRFVACRLVCLCEGSDPPEGTIRRQILVRLLAGKQWNAVDHQGKSYNLITIALESEWNKPVILGSVHVEGGPISQAYLAELVQLQIS